MLRENWELEKEITKYKTGVELNKDFKDEQINKDLLEIRKRNHQIEEWMYVDH